MGQNLYQNPNFLWRWGLGLGLVLLLIFGMYFVHLLISIEDFSNFTIPIYAIIPGTLVFLGFIAIAKSEQFSDISKVSLIFLVIGFASFLAAEQTWNLYEHVLEINPYPSIADVFYIAAPIFMFISLILFLKPISKQISKKHIAFACVISGFLLIPTVFATYEVGAEDDSFEIIIALFYPIVDSLLMISVIIALLHSVAKNQSLFWLMILFGMLIFISADTIFLFLVIDDTYVDGHPVDILWVSSYTIWAFTMYFLIQKAKYSSRTIDDLENLESKSKFEKYGILIALVLINITIGVVFAILTSFLDTTASESVTLAYFGLFMMMIVVIFSGIVFHFNSKIHKKLELETEKIEELSDELIKAERFSAIGSLASRLAHDLRNPLEIIITSNTIIKRKSDNELISKHTDIISRSLERMQHQINNVLDFIRNRPLEIKPIPLNRLIETTLNLLIIPEGIKIIKPTERLNIYCDNEQIIIVLNNLILNAIQKLEDKGIITITYEFDGSNHILKIQDSGAPIPDDTIDKIFEPLYTTKQKGTGLGLASCRQILLQHGGSICVKNNPVTFTIKIPKVIKNY